MPCCRSSTLTSHQPTPVTEFPARQNPEPSSHGELCEQVPATQAGSQTSRQMVSALGLEEEEQVTGGDVVELGENVQKGF